MEDYNVFDSNNRIIAQVSANNGDDAWWLAKEFSPNAAFILLFGRWPNRSPTPILNNSLKNTVTDENK